MYAPQEPPFGDTRSSFTLGLVFGLAGIAIIGLGGVVLYLLFRKDSASAGLAALPLAAPPLSLPAPQVALPSLEIGNTWMHDDVAIL